jgi:hypothetical protein
VVGGPAAHILRCGRFLCSIDSQVGTLSRYDGVTWNYFAGPARRYDSTDSLAVRITWDGQRVEVYDESAATWSYVGNQAGLLYGGPRFVYATDPMSSANALGNLFRFDFGLGSWSLAGLPARHFHRTASGLAAVSWAADAVWFAADSAGGWRQIGDAFQRIDGRKELYGMNNGAVFVYRADAWSLLGTVP